MSELATPPEKWFPNPAEHGPFATFTDYARWGADLGLHAAHIYITTDRRLRAARTARSERRQRLHALRTSLKATLADCRADFISEGATTEAANFCGSTAERAFEQAIEAARIGAHLKIIIQTNDGPISVEKDVEEWLQSA